MINKVHSMAAFLLYSANLILAQDPPPLPDAPTQGPINSLVFLLIGGAVIAVKKYFGNNR